eukprot:9817336-Lingulodinium_polyedra.AAC.1
MERTFGGIAERLLVGPLVLGQSNRQRPKRSATQNRTEIAPGTPRGDAPAALPTRQNADAEETGETH